MNSNKITKTIKETLVRLTFCGILSSFGTICFFTVWYLIVFAFQAPNSVIAEFAIGCSLWLLIIGGVCFYYSYIIWVRL